MSLSRIIKKNSTDEKGLDPPVVVRETTPEHEIDEKKEDDYISFDHILFISDRAITTDIQEKLSDFKGVRSFEKSLFLNRSCEQLLNQGVHHIWANVSSKNCRDWISKSLSQNKSYDVVIVYDGNKHQKWISDIKECYDKPIVVKFKRLKSLKTLNLALDLSSGMIEIHRPLSCLEDLLGCSGLLTGEKKRLS